MYQDIQAGDKVLIEGSSGQDQIVAKHLVSNFTTGTIRVGDKICHYPQASTCELCHQPLPKSDKVREGHIDVFLGQYDHEQKETYDVVYTVEQIAGGFTAKFVGGKRYPLL